MKKRIMKMMRVGSPLVLCAVLLCILSGCATVFGSKNQKIQIHSTPAGADVVIYDKLNFEVYRGVTPVTVDLKRVRGYKVEVSKEGFRKETTKMFASPRGLFWMNPVYAALLGSVAFGTVISSEEEQWVWFVAGACIGGMTGGPIGLIVDLFSSKKWSLSPKIINHRLVAQEAPKPETTVTSPITTTNPAMEKALERAILKAMDRVPDRAKVAVVDVTGGTRQQRELISAMTESYLIDQGFVPIERSKLDLIRAEQNLQLSGEIDDNTAVQIGKIAGVAYIITIRITDTHIIVKCVNVENGELMGSVPERY